MEYNKNQFNKSNEKKILRKVKKQWIVLSIAAFSILGGFELVNSSQMISEKNIITVHADTNEESRGSNDYLSGNATQGKDGQDNQDYQKGVKESVQGYQKGLGIDNDKFIQTKSQNDPNYQYNPNDSDIKVNQQSTSYQTGQQRGGWQKQSYIDNYNNDMKNSSPEIDEQRTNGVSGSYNNRFATNTYQQYPYSYDGYIPYAMSFNQASKAFNDAETNAQNDIDTYNQQNGINDNNNSAAAYQKAMEFTSNTSFQTHRPKISNVAPIQDSYNQNATRSIYDGIINAYSKGLDGGIVSQPSDRNNGNYYFSSNHPGEVDAYNKGYNIYSSTNEAKGAADYIAGSPTQGNGSPHNTITEDADYQRGVQEAEAGYLFKAIGVSTSNIDTTSPEYRRGEIKFAVEDRKNFPADYPSGYTGVYPIGYKNAMHTIPSYNNPDYSSKQSYKAITDAYLNKFGFSDNSSYPYSWDANLIYRTFYNLAAKTFRNASLNALNDYQNGNSYNKTNSDKSNDDDQTKYYDNQPLTLAVYNQAVANIKNQIQHQANLLKPGNSDANAYQKAIDNFYNKDNQKNDATNQYYNQVINGVSDGSKGITTADESGSDIYNIARSQSLGIRNGLLDLSHHNTEHLDTPDNINALAYQDAYRAVQDGYNDKKNSVTKNKNSGAYDDDAIYHYAYDIAGNNDYLKTLGLDTSSNSDDTGKGNSGSKNTPTSGKDNSGSKNTSANGKDNSESKSTPANGKDNSGSKNTSANGKDNSESKSTPANGKDNSGSKNTPASGKDNNGSNNTPASGKDNSGSKNTPASGKDDSGSNNTPANGKDNGGSNNIPTNSENDDESQESSINVNDIPVNKNEIKSNTKKYSPTKNHLSNDNNSYKTKTKLERALGKRAGYRDARNYRYNNLNKLNHKYSSYYMHAYIVSFRKELRKLKPTYVYNINGLYVHNSTNFDRLSRVRGYAKKPRNRAHVFRVHSIAYSKNGTPRYKLIDGGYITINNKYVLDAYYRHHNEPISKIRVIKPIGTYIYNSKQFNERTAVKKMPYGSIVKVKSIKKLGPITRFYLGHGKYISSNKTIVDRVS